MVIVTRTGSVSLKIRSEYQAKATKADIKSLRITLSGGPLSAPVMQTVGYPPTADVTFTEIPAGSVSLKIEALDASSAVIGSASKSGITVSSGQLTSVSLTLQLTPTQVTDGNGMVGIGLIINDGDIVIKPTPAPSPTPTPRPTIAPTPVPTVAPTSAPVSGSVLYVSTSGNDANAGTSSSPLRTISAAAARAKAGMTILINGGTYYEQVVTKVGGAAGQEIVFKSVNGTAVIDGSNLGWGVGSNQNQGLVELRHPYVRLEGLKITKSKNSDVILNADNLTIKGCEISSAQRHGISTDTGRQTAAGGTMIKNVLIEGNTITDCVIGGNGSGQAISLIADGFTIRGNRMSGNHEIPIDVWLGSKHGEVVDNDIYDNVGQTAIYMDGATYVRIHRNKCYRNAMGITASAEDSRYNTHHIWVYNNLVYDNTRDGCTVWDPDTGPTEIYFFNNTLVNNSKSFYFGGSGLKVEVWNNLGQGAGTTWSDATNSTVNIHDNTWLSSATGFVNAGGKDFRLTSSSTAINKGKALPSMVYDNGQSFSVSTDYAQLNRVAGGAPDQGAYEYQ